MATKSSLLNKVDDNLGWKAAQRWADITKSDLLIINKTDLAPMVGASLEVMDKDTKRMRGDKPYLFTNLKDGENVDAVIAFIKDKGML